MNKFRLIAQVDPTVKQVGDRVSRDLIDTFKYIGGIICSVIAVIMAIMFVISVVGVFRAPDQDGAKTTAILKSVAFLVGGGLFTTFAVLLF